MIRKILLYALYFVIVVGLGVALIVSFSHDAKAPTVPKPPSAQAPSRPPKPTTPPKVSDKAKAASEATKAAIASTTGTAALANTGPGSVAALFVGSSLVAGLVYNRHQRSRLV